MHIRPSRTRLLSFVPRVPHHQDKSGSINMGQNDDRTDENGTRTRKAIADNSRSEHGLPPGTAVINRQGDCQHRMCLREQEWQQAAMVESLPGCGLLR